MDAAPRPSMQTILNQLGDLLLGSVPTVIFFLILLAAYAVLVRKPLEKVLAARYSRTGGAMDEARQAIRVTEEKTAAYETRLRDARSEVFAARAARQKASAAARDKALAEARDAAQRRTEAARQSIERSAAEAQAQMEQSAAALSQAVIEAILPHRAAGRDMGAAS